ncbi:hypothetical protein A2917_02315 [Candidatus Nomurabacteria bacterium RIFCSPLOWO2_01_FULL_42_17]|uniref:AAA+ ATPase domain-containing protein n=1 Tax=Candidatus Nomurabacteria bacterium RIFCSPLOWO2_01_FULL_42_17 TaxID=1801780 RepID=A0A1F6XMM9_9BACT|nr:MAG: hypothetical protein A2917_02315 [Candidatus Nomurabacteria bacterium RIFCSPLOWO2_01_FULL_42_17]
MTQNEALAILKTGANVFLTGEPGAGKTYTINQFVSYLRARDIEPAITASTGIAATHIGGMTIHSWSGIGIKETLTKYDLDKIGSSEYLNRRIGKTRVLIIDEVSMLRAETLLMIDAVCREIKQSALPFGGLQVILVGDFFQLPPIEKRLYEKSAQQSLIKQETKGIRDKTRFAFDSDVWRRLSPVVCYLTEQHRQDDADFLSVLSAIRRGSMEKPHLDQIHSRMSVSMDFPENIPKLFSHNVNVDQVNGGMLGKIEMESKHFLMTASGGEAIISALKRGCLSPEDLELKVGAVVMCTKNNPKERFVNGTLGTVIEFEQFTGYPIIKTKNGRNITVAPMDWSVEENGKIKAKITQVPLRLAWAITVHKSQGMSMDAAVMDLSEVFEFGQGYVALSRVRRLSGLYLLGINERAFKVHPQILEKDVAFREGSKQACEVFARISSEDNEKMRKNFIITLGGKWKPETSSLIKEAPAIGRLEQIREKHQNAYKKWTQIEETEVAQAFKSGKSLKNISVQTGRQVGGIRSRLVKLGLIEE